VKRFVSLQFLYLRQSVGRLGRGISPSQGRYLTQTQNKYEETSMPWVGFKPRSQCSSGRKQFMHWTARPLRSADKTESVYKLIAHTAEVYQYLQFLKP
jgi:hypothetical protein